MEKFADIETRRVYGRKYGDVIRGRLAAEGVTEFSDAEIERGLSPCVCGPWLVPVAKQMRDDGISLAA